MNLFKNAGIEADERFALEMLLRAFETSRKRHLVDEDDEDLILSGDGADLSAVNHDGRIIWAKAVCRELAKFFGYDAVRQTTDQTIWLVTLVHLRALKSSAILNVDIERLKRLLRRGVWGLNYVGVIEPALYSCIRAHTPKHGPASAISWHLHLLVWGQTRQEVRELIARLEASGEYQAVSEKMAGAHFRRVVSLEATARYLLKAPKNSYRLAAGGSQYKSKLRPGERITLYLQMKHLSLDELWLSGGEGRGIFVRIKRRARQRIRLLKRKAAERAERHKRPSISLSPVA